MKRQTTHLRLFRTAASAHNEPRYTGTLLVPGVPPMAYNVQAWIEEKDSGNGTGTVKCLCGFISGGQAVNAAKAPKGDGKAPTGDLLAPLADLPFDDPLPQDVGK